MIEEKAATQFNQMSTAFRNKAQEFAQQVISQVNRPPPPQTQTAEQQQQPIPAISEPPPSADVGNEPQAYHEENRHSEFGILFKITKINQN